jgi:hypothetical protein
MADDIQGLLKSVQDYLVRGGLDKDARYYLGPHAYEGLSNIASLANFIGPGADIKDIASESAKVMEGDPAAFVGPSCCISHDGSSRIEEWNRRSYR